MLTGMVRYDQIDIDAPVSDAFEQVGLAVGAVPGRRSARSTGITSVLLVMMLSQPRVLLAMARDGLVPPSFFGAVHDEVPHALEVDDPDRRVRRARRARCCRCASWPT